LKKKKSLEKGLVEWLKVLGPQFKPHNRQKNQKKIIKITLLFILLHYSKPQEELGFFVLFVFCSTGA
jgi:hypothetical protein